MKGSRSSFPRLLPLAVVPLLISGCADIERYLGIDNAERHDVAAGVAPVEAPVVYGTRVMGDIPKAVRGPLDASLRLLTEKERPPASLAALGRRVDDDVERAKDVLASEGYLDARVTATIDADVEPVLVTVEIDPGPRFTLGAVEIRYEPAEPPTEVPRVAADLGLSIGQAATGAALVEAERRLVRRLKESGYPNASLSGRQYLANREDNTVRAVLTATPGPLARFGPLGVEGLRGVNPDYIRRIADWREGGPYDIREIERVRQVLARTRLFATITPPPRDDVVIMPDGTVPVVFEVGEGPWHSVGVGAFYSTDDQGPGGSINWEDRNLFGGAERLRARIEGSMVQQSAELDFRKPAFYALDQSLLANLAIINNDTDAFTGITGTGSIALERRFAPFWTLKAGPTVIYSNITRSAVNQAGEQFLLGGGRARLLYDSRDDLLDPTRGVNGSLDLAPLTSLALTSTRFMITDASLAGYQGLFANDRVVLAARARLGSIVGAANSQVPASQRFYAGGGGSVRGYAFQSIGPLNNDNNPLGGRSLIELNAETRIKIVEPFGIVPFIDGGQVYETVYPKFTDTLQWAAGLGFRYYSPIGPIRLDLAFPLNPRPVDDAFQFYISIGQAF